MTGLFHGRTSPAAPCRPHMARTIRLAYHALTTANEPLLHVESFQPQTPDFLAPVGGDPVLSLRACGVCLRGHRQRAPGCRHGRPRCPGLLQPEPVRGWRGGAGGTGERTLARRGAAVAGLLRLPGAGRLDPDRGAAEITLAAALPAAQTAQSRGGYRRWRPHPQLPASPAQSQPDRAGGGGVARFARCPGRG